MSLRTPWRPQGSGSARLNSGTAAGRAETAGGGGGVGGGGEGGGEIGSSLPGKEDVWGNAASRSRGSPRTDCDCGLRGQGRAPAGRLKLQRATLPLRFHCQSFLACAPTAHRTSGGKKRAGTTHSLPGLLCIHAPSATAPYLLGALSGWTSGSSPSGPADLALRAKS